MSTRAAALYALQEVDLEIDAIRRRLAETRAGLGESEAVRQAHTALAAAEADLKRWATRQRDLELEVAGLSAKLDETNARLYGGRIRNPKELTDLQNDVAALGRHRRALEDDLLEAMVNVEDGTAAVAAARRRLNELESDWQAGQARLRADAAQLEDRLETLAGERDAHLMSVAAGDPEIYEGLRRRRGGLAVALLEDGACSACGVAPSSKRLQQARQSEELVTCDNCDRILHVL